MNTNVKSNKVQVYHKIFLFAFLFVSLLSCMVLTSVDGVSLDNAVHVTNEVELKNAVNNVPYMSSVVIALGRDITLTGSLVISGDKNVTLTSNSAAECFKLIGVAYQSTIIVEYRAILNLDGIIVTHASSGSGSNGVTVQWGSTLILCSGKISGNAEYGVYNSGTFSMTGGEISDNTCGGVVNAGDFSMCGGAISNNTARAFGAGGGVSNSGMFTMFGGEISYNTADTCGGVSNSEDCSFIMIGGKIFGNRAEYSGGGVLNGGNFSMSGGEISGNTVTNTGGGVANIGIFIMTGGEISGNTAQNGGGVYVGNVFSNKGFFELSSGKISDNKASNDGGGIWVDIERLDHLSVGDWAVFSNNQASVAYNRNAIHDTVYAKHIGNNVIWTTPFTQGYNNYDISYTSGTSIDMGNNNESDSNNNNNNNNNGSDLDGGVFDTGGMWSGLFSYNMLIGAAFVVVIIIIIGVVMFLFQKTKNVHKEKNKQTIVTS